MSRQSFLGDPFGSKPGKALANKGKSIDDSVTTSGMSPNDVKMDMAVFTEEFDDPKTRIKVKGEPWCQTEFQVNLKLGLTPRCRFVCPCCP